ncbi:MerR family transcriptional regulator [Rhabdochromatium marinum]|uniref:MerR family transcriptional regulator n=1 Tax=Rhabdochromatium marinum TaxID=48729 RepID=UPI0019060682|nr:MerR family transcriptional regulator [Rhabdochromatium marinum]MBK1649506.1 hypothetical protein [Rhabdochromatium marinum]
MSKIYRINEFAKRIGKAPSTIRRWEREGKLVAKRHPSGHRYFDEADVRLLTGGAPEKRAVVVYCRVSSARQKDDSHQEALSPQQEMVEDLLAIVHTFSYRLYGLRKYQREIKADFSECSAVQPKALCE